MKKKIVLGILLLLWYNGMLFGQMTEQLDYYYWRSLNDEEKISFVRGIISGMYATGFALIEYTDGDVAGIASFLPNLRDTNPAIFTICVIELAYEIGFTQYTPGFIVFYQEELMGTFLEYMSLEMIKLKTRKIKERLSQVYEGQW